MPVATPNRKPDFIDTECTGEWWFEEMIYRDSGGLYYLRYINDILECHVNDHWIDDEANAIDAYRNYIAEKYLLEK